VFLVYQKNQVESIPLNIQIEVRYQEIDPPDLVPSLGDKFKVSKDISYSDFMRLISHNFKERLGFTIRDARDNSVLDDESSFSAAIKNSIQ